MMIEWTCPNCPAVQRTVDQRTPLHDCPGLHGLTVGLVRGNAKITLVERQDYIGTEVGVRMVNRRPIMSVVTERDDGTDAVVYAPSATVAAQ